MGEDFMKGLQNFDRVWSRVTGGVEIAPMTCVDDAEALREFIADESGDAAFYLALSRRTGGRTARTFRCIADDERRHKRALQLEYFLLTGDSFIAAPSCPVVGSIMDAVRLAYSGEAEGAERYMTAADTTKSDRLGELYRLHASDERAHAERLRMIVSRIIS